MKSLFLVPLLFLFLCCEKDKNDGLVFDESNFPKKWELVEMTGSYINAMPLRGSDMPWQSHYVFNPDSSFQKFRTTNGETIMAKGTFKWMVSDDERYLSLSFTNGNELVESCSPITETLFYGEGVLTGSWMMCDGPGLIYEPILE